jgi:cobalt-zinc-cadmium efflux system membrane fusion protein
MQSQDHRAMVMGRAFLWGGIALGLIVLVALLTRGFGLMGEAGTSAPEAAPAVMERGRIRIPEGSPLRQRIATQTAAAEAISAKLELPGLVESEPSRTAAVLAPLGGRIVEIRVALGDRVRQGQALAVIDSADLAQARDDNDKAAAAAQLAQRNLARQEGQYKLGAISSRDLDQARSDNTQAAAEYTRTQARLKVLGVPDGGDDRRSSLLTVAAPVAGSVIALSIARGNMINDPTQPIMTVADLSTVWVTAFVPEKDVASVAKDQEAQVALVAYPGQLLHGRVLFVSDVIDPDSRRGKLRIAFPNPGYQLKPNMFATVTLTGPRQTRVVIPTSALLMNNDRTSVFVATAPWIFERRTVKPRIEEGDRVTIESGLEGGEQVVVKGGVLLND